MSERRSLFCVNCGAQLRAGARFCQDCGARHETVNPAEDAAEETRLSPARLPFQTVIDRTVNAPPDAASRRAYSLNQPDEQIIFSERPTSIFIFAGYFVAAFAALVLTILLAFISAGRIPPFVCALLSLPLLLIPAIRHLRRNSTLYTLTDSKIEITNGLLSRTTRNIPLRNIQNVTVSMTLWQRVFNYGDILIDIFGEINRSARLYHITSPRQRADEILRAQRQR